MVKTIQKHSINRICVSVYKAKEGSNPFNHAAVLITGACVIDKSVWISRSIPAVLKAIKEVKRLNKLKRCSKCKQVINNAK